MNDVSTRFNIPKELLQIAKKNGCPGFAANGRIYWDIVEPYFNNHRLEYEGLIDDDISHWNLVRMRSEALMAERRLAEKQSQLWRKDETMVLLDSVNNQMKTILKNKLTIELPARFNGKTAIDMSIEGENLLNDICMAIQAIKI